MDIIKLDQFIKKRQQDESEWFLNTFDLLFRFKFLNDKKLIALAIGYFYRETF